MDSEKGEAAPANSAANSDVLVNISTKASLPSVDALGGGAAMIAVGY